MSSFFSMSYQKKQQPGKPGLSSISIPAAVRPKRGCFDAAILYEFIPWNLRDNSWLPMCYKQANSVPIYQKEEPFLSSLTISWLILL